MFKLKGETSLLPKGAYPLLTHLLTLLIKDPILETALIEMNVKHALIKIPTEVHINPAKTIDKAK